MKKTTISLVIVLCFSMIIPVLQIMPIVSSDSPRSRVADGIPSLAATPGSDVHVIQVGEDTFTLSSEPSLTHDNFGSHGGLVCGNDSGGGGYMARIWLKFDLTHIPHTVAFTRATLNLYMVHSFDDADEPFGVYTSGNDSWAADTITWDNEPDLNPVPMDVIDSPSSPNTFADDNWYEWEITDAVLQTISEDGILTLVLRQVDESLSIPSMKGFISRENSVTDDTNTIPNIALEYETPSASNLTVDGFSESPQIDYISSSTPDLGWEFNDDDPSDLQTNYEVEVWNSTTYNETQLMEENHTHYSTLHSTNWSGALQDNILNYAYDTRVQYRWPASLIADSGVVDKLYFEVDVETGETTFTDLAIFMVCGGLSSPTSSFEDNYNGQVPIQVLNRSEYTARIDGGYMIFDVENLFCTNSSWNLYVEIRHGGASGTARGYYSNTAVGDSIYVYGPGAYASETGVLDSTFTQGIKLELTNEVVLNDRSTVYSGLPLVNATRYFWRVRTCDSMGLWSQWETGSFKYEKLTSLPTWSNLVETAQPLEFGESMTISVNVTHPSGIVAVVIEYDGANHSMANTEHTYSHTWTPSLPAVIYYTIYMQSVSGTWNSLSDRIQVTDTTAPEWINEPSDVVLYYGEALSMQLSASDLSGIGKWTINDNVNFDITGGLLTNKTTLTPGGYPLNVTVTDDEGNSLSATFIVAVLQPTDTTSTTTTTSTSTTTGETNTSGTTPSAEIDPTSLMIIIGLGFLVVVLLIVIVILRRRM